MDEQDEFLRLEKRLKNHDYTYMMSDDYRVQRVGRHHAETTQQLINKLKLIDKERVKSLVDKYKKEEGTHFEV